jgi:hypothetical protein
MSGSSNPAPKSSERPPKPNPKKQFPFYIINIPYSDDHFLLSERSVRTTSEDIATVCEDIFHWGVRPRLFDTERERTHMKKRNTKEYAVGTHWVVPGENGKDFLDITGENTDSETQLSLARLYE